MITQSEAKQLLLEKVKAPNLQKHCLAVSAIMQGLAEEVDEDAEQWAICGLVHDIDFGETESKPEKHGIIAQEILRDKVSEDILHSILAHNWEHTSTQPETKMDFALIAADAVSGLIIATALIYPSKKLADVNLKSITKRFKAKDFARACRRDNMLYCEKLELEKEKFFEVALESLKKISDDLEL